VISNESLRAQLSKMTRPRILHSISRHVKTAAAAAAEGQAVGVSVAGRNLPPQLAATYGTTRTQISPARGTQLASPDIDCAGLPHGPAMEAKKADATEGQAVKCRWRAKSTATSATTCTTRTQISPARGPKLASPEDIDAPVSPHGPAMEAS
jgi:hypothetical protein